MSNACKLVQIWLSNALKYASITCDQVSSHDILGCVVSFLEGVQKNSLTSRFHADGFVICPAIISRKSIAGFVRQIQEELKSPSFIESERCVGSLLLNDPKTWPQKGARRVVECAPAGVGEHWKGLRRGLTPILNQLMGENCWEMPFNTGEPGQIRHVYFPITFPEHIYSGGKAGTGNAARSASSKSKAPNHVDGYSCTSSRPVRLESWKDEVRRTPFTSESLDAPLRWQPVSRRRFRGKGWHIDIGPGFSTDAKRRFSGVRECDC